MKCKRHMAKSDKLRRLLLQQFQMNGKNDTSGQVIRGQIYPTTSNTFGSPQCSAVRACPCKASVPPPLELPRTKIAHSAVVVNCHCGHLKSARTCPDHARGYTSGLRRKRGLCGHAVRKGFLPRYCIEPQNLSRHSWAKNVHAECENDQNIVSRPPTGCSRGPRTGSLLQMGRDGTSGGLSRKKVALVLQPRTGSALSSPLLLVQTNSFDVSLLVT